MLIVISQTMQILWCVEIVNAFVLHSNHSENMLILDIFL